MAQKEKWNYETSNKLIDELEEWMMEDVTLWYRGNPAGNAKMNLFWREFLYEKGIYNSIIHHLRNKFPNIDDRLKDLESIQEERLQSLAFRGLGKEQMAKFLLSSKYGYKEKTEHETTHISKNFNINDLIGFDDEENSNI